MTAFDGPDYLPARLKERYAQLYDWAAKAGTVTWMDGDLLAKYVVAEDTYLAATRQMQEAVAMGDAESAAKWLGVQDKMVAQTLRLGGELGLTPSARRALGISVPRR